MCPPPELARPPPELAAPPPGNPLDCVPVGPGLSDGGPNEDPVVDDDDELPLDCVRNVPRE